MKFGLCRMLIVMAHLLTLKQELLPGFAFTAAHPKREGDRCPFQMSKNVVYV